MSSKRARSSEASGSRISPDLESEASKGFTGEKFISPEAQEEYRRLKTKTIIKERGFVPVSTDGNLVSMIENMDWVAVCETPPPVPITIVHEFYANAKAERNGSVVVRGITVDYTPEAIRRLLELPAKPDGFEDWAQKIRADVDLDILIAEIYVPVQLAHHLHPVFWFLV